MRTLIRSALALAATAAALAAPLQAHAGLFDDDEARRAILDIRARIDRIVEAFAAPLPTGQTERVLSASFGFVMVPIAGGCRTELCSGEDSLH